MWVKCKDKSPSEGGVYKIMYSDGTITTGLYRGNRTWQILIGKSDKSVYVEYWWKETEPKKTIHWTMFERTTAK